MKVKVHNEIKDVTREEMEEEVVRYYDATGAKHFYMEVEEMDDDELKALYENSYASEE
ncbi:MULTISPECIES: hypothetical protein [Coprobacillaceae]|mgnify:FL=1|uniref:hypothetical protein n=1 Tax=Coprobacillaceae TaxID=2810280 RepID=UPI001314260D|nr:MULTISPECIES: hypothetical protein [Coprobacillaceae]